MQYAFVTNVFQWNSVGGPQSRARNMATMLKRHADFPFRIVKSGFKDFFSKNQPDLVHVQSNNELLDLCMKKGLRLIAGPNVGWKRVSNKCLKYQNMACALIQRPDPMPKKLKPIWVDRIREFPAFVDEQYFEPKKKKKSIDILTVGKSFNYDPYEANLMKLMNIVSKFGLKHKHLKRYSMQEYKDALDRSKLLLYPSPREAGASLCHVLLECSMMNVPFIGLDSVVIERDFEYHPCRGMRVKTINEMAESTRSVLRNLDQFGPRSWVIERFSIASAYNRFKLILEEIS